MLDQLNTLIANYTYNVEIIEFLEKNQIKVPYVVTMHGSHDRDFTDENIMKEIVKYVSKWVYIVECNRF